MVVNILFLLFVMMLSTLVVPSPHVLKKNVCMYDEVVLNCPNRLFIAVTDVLFRSRLKIFRDRSSCTVWTQPWNNCTSSIDFHPLLDQCQRNDTCKIVMDYNPCSQYPLLYATIYYECTESGYGTTDPYQLIKLYGNRFRTATSLTAPSTASLAESPTTSSTASSTINIPDLSAIYKDHKNDDGFNKDNNHQIHNDNQSNKQIKIGLEIAIGITSFIAIVALIYVIKSRLHKREQRPNPTPRRNRLSYDQDHMFQNPSIYQIAVSNPGYSNRMGDTVDTSNESGYALHSYEEAVSHNYEQVNLRVPKVSNVLE
ncbi:uncharacterized protein LOC134693207 isoform X1 [Mytilus trossulus]|uniref:uncharacterized protein LOC134693207 isoform X1 n=1 Tax=Mytilus trossulus TaxID=6551 RepID=UPI0030067B42